MSEKFQVYVSLIKEAPKAILSLFFGMIFMLVSGMQYCYSENLYGILLVISASFTFSAFDALGHHYVLLHKHNQSHIAIDSECIAAYRIIQTFFQFFLYFVCFSAADVTVLISLMTWHFMGVNDWLYYKLLQQTIPENLTWLYWTPVGFYYEILNKKPTPRNCFIIQTVVGIMLSLGIIIIYN